MVSAQGTRIVATGCTSGLGVSAIRHILQTSPSTLPPPYHIILLGRTTSPSSPAVRTRDELSAIAAAIDVSGSGSTESSVDLVSCDLSSLTSVDEAAKDILRKIKSPPQPPAAGGRAWKEISPDRIDVLLLNAAVAKTTRTLVRAPAPTTNDADGVDSLKDEQDQYEEMALVNHVGQCVAMVVQCAKMTMIILTPPYTSSHCWSVPRSTTIPHSPASSTYAPWRRSAHATSSLYRLVPPSPID